MHRDDVLAVSYVRILVLYETGLTIFFLSCFVVVVEEYLWKFHVGRGIISSAVLENKDTNQYVMQ